MILTVDLGNTSTKLGLFDGDLQVSFLCHDGVSENFRSLILSFIYKANLREDAIDKAILSCVVPHAYDQIYDALASIVGERNIIDINPNVDYGIKLVMPNPQDTGDDLIVMCSYAYNLYQREMLIVSMGTATVICHVTKNGEFKHCIIAPGFSKIAETLWKNAAQLPEFEMKPTYTYLADNTVDAMNVGIYNGYIGMLKSLIYGMKSELGQKDIYIIGCGGLGKKLAPYLNIFNEYDPDFVTKGLNHIAQRYLDD
ncbi:MAG: type III pantothenate kinase [Erysipelotrichaceae bacterium]|nr:type III pantothenate kinase [Erysipelotrichaceae bacterium]